MVIGIFHVAAPTVESTISISIDNPPFQSLEEIAENSPVIVYGRYLKTLQDNNTDNDSHLENLYSFQVEQVLKGSAVSENIIISKVSHFDITDSINNTIGKDAENNTYHLPWPYFVKSEFNDDYILFLRHTGGKDIYQCFGEPWEIVFDKSGIASLKSNTFNPDKSFADTYIINVKPKTSSTKHKININIPLTKYGDFILGQTYGEILKTIENIVNTKRP